MNSQNRILSIIVLMVISWTFASPASAEEFFVDQSVASSGNGLSWATAFQTFQEALVAAQPSGEDVIWVAAGQYRPDQDAANPNGDGDRNASFDLPPETEIYGGFAGTENFLSERDIFANPTILSGDINIPGISTDNSYHVVTVSTIEQADSPRLDGFIIRDGNASGGGDDDFGGGLFIKDANVWIVNCRFESNRTTQGSAVAVVLSEMYARLSVKPLFVNCAFIENISSDHSQIYNEGNITLNNCCFEVEADDYQEKDIIMNRSLDGGEASADCYDCTFNGSAIGKRAMDS